MVYLAMTAAEFRGCQALPANMAWMACHFSPYGTGLSNLPRQLPPGSILILNDRTPVRGHDPALIKATLERTAEKFSCAGLLLDLQRPNCGETAAIVKELLSLPFPVAVSEGYAGETDCPIFLPPVPLNMELSEYLQPWQGREIWLEAALDGAIFTVTGRGCTTAPMPTGESPDCPHQDEVLHCRYHIDILPDAVRFTLRRGRADLDALLADAQNRGVTHCVGLWQELGDAAAV